MDWLTKIKLSRSFFNEKGEHCEVINELGFDYVIVLNHATKDKYLKLWNDIKFNYKVTEKKQTAKKEVKQLNLF